MPQSEPPRLPWPGAVVWRHVARAQGPGLGPELRPRFDWLGSIQVSEPYEYPAHHHAAFEIIAPVRGRYRCLLDGAELTLRPGEALVVSPGQRHQDRLAPPLAYIGVAFHLDGCQALFRPEAPANHRIARTAGLLETLPGLAVEVDAADRIAARIQDALLTVLFWRLVRGLPQHALAPALLARLDDDAFPVRLARAIDARLERPSRLGDLAREVGISPRGLTAACRRHGLPPPMAQLAEARLLRAHDLLAGGSREVKEVAQALAFANPFHFSRAFRRRFGVPPSAVADMPGATPGMG